MARQNMTKAEYIAAHPLVEARRIESLHSDNPLEIVPCPDGCDYENCCGWRLNPIGEEVF